MSGARKRAAGIGAAAPAAAGGGAAASAAAASAAGAAAGDSASPSPGDGGSDDEEQQQDASDTSAREAALQAQLLLLQQRMAEFEAKEARREAVAAMAATAAAVAAAEDAGELAAEAAEALSAAGLAQADRQAAAVALAGAAAMEAARPGEPASLAEMQQRIAQAVEAALHHERVASMAAAGAAAGAAEAARQYGAGSLPQGSPPAAAVAQRSLLLPSPRGQSPPAVLRMAQSRGAALAGVQSSGSVMAAATTIAAFKSLQPPELRAVDASKGTTLEDWIYSVERLIGCAGAQAFAARVELARMCWDRQVNTWWTGTQELAQTRGKPIGDWDGLVAALRANYTPISDVDTARRALYTLAMKGGESMEHYVARAHELYNRIPRARVPSEVAAEFLVDGVDARRFPLAQMTVGASQQHERAHGNAAGLTFDAARSMLVEAAAIEPTHLIASAQSSTSAGAGSGHAHRGGYSGRQRVNNIMTRAESRYPQPEDEGEADSQSGADEQHGVSTIDVADVKCFRCQGRGHFARDCSKPDTRVCNLCKKKGHLARACTARATEPGENGGGAGGKANASATSGPKPKN